MCAAPGSKTAQLIEMMHAGETDSLPGRTTSCRYCIFVFAISNRNVKVHYRTYCVGRI